MASDFDELLKIQQRMQKKIAEEKNTDDTIEIIMIMTELSPGNQRIQKEQLLVEGSIRGFSESYMNAMIERLIRERLIFMPSPGFLQKR
ncbi:hypothetical protein C0585_02040 [Candidatus Woesearchaeota archaeon]|nr:MAG: hypothetical protein C0585_02040 [Candidatus Woesearchaeota archaeon]